MHEVGKGLMFVPILSWDVRPILKKKKIEGELVRYVGLERRVDSSC